jgi:hypothetical protein
MHWKCAADHSTHTIHNGCILTIGVHVREHIHWQIHSFGERRDRSSQRFKKQGFVRREMPIRGVRHQGTTVARDVTDQLRGQLDRETAHTRTVHRSKTHRTHTLMQPHPPTHTLTATHIQQHIKPNKHAIVAHKTNGRCCYLLSSSNGTKVACSLASADNGGGTTCLCHAKKHRQLSNALSLNGTASGCTSERA